MGKLKVNPLFNLFGTAKYYDRWHNIYVPLDHGLDLVQNLLVVNPAHNFSPSQTLHQISQTFYLILEQDFEDCLETLPFAKPFKSKISLDDCQGLT